MRLIDADLIMDCLLNEGQNNGEKYGIKWGDKIRFSPSEVAEIVARTIPIVDAVPVVRCKDCKHAVPETYYKSWDYKCILFQHAMMADDYCSHGKRKEKE